MEQSPSWEAKSNSTSQEVPRLLWDTEVNFREYKSPRLVSI